tara:strand:- start:604 stop:1341 length:738 start_codon:yes stop_codon:yes gene_type:complete
MDPSKFIYLIIILIVLYYLISWYTSTSTSLSKRTSTDIQTIQPGKKTYTSGHSYAYSIWFNITDWTHQFGNDKIIFIKRSSALGDIGATYDDAAAEDVLVVSLAAYENNLHILVPYKKTETDRATHKCIIYGIPIQKWVNIILSFDQKVLDVYMDGKLVKTCIMPKVPDKETSASSHNLYLSPTDATFKGEISNFKFFKSSLNPQEAWQLYKEGFGSGALSGLVNRYKMKIAFLKDDQEFNSFML